MHLSYHTRLVSRFPIVSDKLIAKRADLCYHSATMVLPACLSLMQCTRPRLTLAADDGITSGVRDYDPSTTKDNDDSFLCTIRTGNLLWSPYMLFN